jgi:hypothetical protein
MERKKDTLGVFFLIYLELLKLIKRIVSWLKVKR